MNTVTGLVLPLRTMPLKTTLTSGQHNF